MTSISQTPIPGASRPTLDAISRPSGAFAMVAMDQRESLVAMFDAAGSGRPPRAVVTGFKLEVAKALGPVASGFLIDNEYGFQQVRDDGLLPEGSGLILAADALTQEVGGPVEETALDQDVLSEEFNLSGVSALKLLIIWRRDDKREDRVKLAQDFIAAARDRGVLSVLEPVVRATQTELDEGSWDMDAAIREAARELSPLRPSLYKSQVPMGGLGDAQEQVAASAKLGESITGPWVVLSQGVPADRFQFAVESACRGGASGFLAGRALWSDVVGHPDVERQLRSLSVPRLERLVEVVDREARSWASA